jgi:cytochrome b
MIYYGVMKKKIRIWDLPIRIFHWMLVSCIIASFVTVNIGGNAMQWHGYIGYCILVLILFRVSWGFFGSYHARFLNFVPSVTSLMHYLQGNSKAVLGHNPLGSFSVLALLFSVGLQAVTGLFSNDEIAFEGPFSKYASNATVELVTAIHSINSTILIILIALHLSAIAYYQIFKRENLIRPMLVGDKEIDPSEEAQYSPTDLGRASKDGSLQRGFALVLLSLIAIILGYFITA